MGDNGELVTSETAWFETAKLDEPFTAQRISCLLYTSASAILHIVEKFACFVPHSIIVKCVRAMTAKPLKTSCDMPFALRTDRIVCLLYTSAVPFPFDNKFLETRRFFPLICFAGQ